MKTEATESSKLREVKSILRNQQRIRTVARAKHYADIEEAFRIAQEAVVIATHNADIEDIHLPSTSSSIVAPPISLIAGNWTAVRFDSEALVWSRQLLSGDKELFTANRTSSGQWELCHSTEKR